MPKSTELRVLCSSLLSVARFMGTIKSGVGKGAQIARDTITRTRTRTRPQIGPSEHYRNLTTRASGVRTKMCAVNLESWIQRIRNGVKSFLGCVKVLSQRHHEVFSRCYRFLSRTSIPREFTEIANVYSKDLS